MEREELLSTIRGWLKLEFMTSDTVKRLARECGFELVGVAAALPAENFARYREWVDRGYAGEMRYLTDHRAEVRSDPRNLLASARSIVCVGKLYNIGEVPHAPGQGIVSRYAWGEDYHDVLRAGLERLVALLEREAGKFEYKICVDTAPLLERSYARLAGLGWIGKNTCLINEPQGSWFFLGEIITSLELDPDAPPPDRCGTCTRCIDECPTQALVPDGDRWALDSRRCISYLTIELRGPIPEEHHAAMGAHIFGCDICQDVCPWNRRAPVTTDPAFQPLHAAPELDAIANLTPEEFRARYRGSAITRTKHAGFSRNVAVAIRNGAIEA